MWQKHQGKKHGQFLNNRNNFKLKHNDILF